MNKLTKKTLSKAKTFINDVKDGFIDISTTSYIIFFALYAFSIYTLNNRINGEYVSEPLGVLAVLIFFPITLFLLIIIGSILYSLIRIIPDSITEIKAEKEKEVLLQVEKQRIDEKLRIANIKKNKRLNNLKQRGIEFKYPLIEYVEKYKSFGFNITHISEEDKGFHHEKETNLKTPSHFWDYLTNFEQSLSNAKNFDWDFASGIGTVLGYKILRAIDVDNCSDFGIIEDFLMILGLPKNYEWVVKSGSGKGFHIIFISKAHAYRTTEHKIKAFVSNNQNSEKFDHLELRWLGHLVLPPSIHPSGKQYEFYFNFNEIPKESPKYVHFDRVPILINKYCSDRVPLGVSGFFLHFGIHDELIFKMPENETIEIQLQKPQTEIIKKANWLDFNKLLIDKRITKLYHFTDRSNLISIREYGGLCSWYKCKGEKIKIRQPGGSELSRELDIYHKLEDYVRLSFTRKHPMMYVAGNDGRINDPVILEIDIDVVFWNSTKFTDMNATKSGHSIGNDINDFKKIKFDLVKQQNHFNISEDLQKYYQAEILVKNFIPLKYIMNIDKFK